MSVAVQYRKPKTPTHTKNSADEEKSPCRKPAMLLPLHNGSE